jgi:hypothetical protein
MNSDKGRPADKTSTRHHTKKHSRRKLENGQLTPWSWCTLAHYKLLHDLLLYSCSASSCVPLELDYAKYAIVTIVVRFHFRWLSDRYSNDRKAGSKIRPR